MTMDNSSQQVVQPDEVLPEGTPSPAVVTPLEPSPEDILNQKIADAVSKVLAVETEKSRREIQSAKDKAMAEVQIAQRRARLAEGTLSSTRAHLQTLDPDTAKEMELAELRAEKQNRLVLEQEETQRQQQEAQGSALHDSLLSHLEELGIAPDDKRIDWARDSSNYVQGRRRFDASIAKIQKENIKALETSIDVKIKEAEKRIKKDLGGEDVNSVSTQMSGGVSGEGIPTDMVAFRKWIAGVPQKEYEEKYALKVTKMMREGKIK